MNCNSQVYPDTIPCLVIAEFGDAQSLYAIEQEWPQEPSHNNMYCSLEDQYCLCELFTKRKAFEPVLPPLNKISSSIHAEVKEEEHELNEQSEFESIPKDSNGNPLYSIRSMKRIMMKTQARFHFSCRVNGCKRTFNNLSEMEDHLENHTKIRPYACPLCSKSYTQRGNMIKHRRSHTNPSIDSRKRFVCEFCQKGYTEKYNLKTHQKKFHPEEYTARLRQESHNNLF
ncbi:unnamed protein product [Moneuplotes crassus]|uniref:C2H2-type domain-containing protein n=1 Tax=Euplotes crassus TaxID=5936 RepID=A0AAD1Y8Z7_EUPCR|nr:unnamed protein product [Moneuplotes crassus]